MLRNSVPEESMSFSWENPSPYCSPFFSLCWQEAGDSRHLYTQTLSLLTLRFPLCSLRHQHGSIIPPEQFPSHGSLSKPVLAPFLGCQASKLTQLNRIPKIQVKLDVRDQPTSVRVPKPSHRGGISLFRQILVIILIKSCNFLLFSGGRRRQHIWKASIAIFSFCNKPIKKKKF